RRNDKQPEANRRRLRRGGAFEAGSRARRKKGRQRATRLEEPALSKAKGRSEGANAASFRTILRPPGLRSGGMLRIAACGMRGVALPARFAPDLGSYKGRGAGVGVSP